MALVGHHADAMEDNSDKPPQPAHQNWRYPLALGICLVTVFMIGRSWRSGPSDQLSDPQVVDPVAAPVMLTIETDQGAKVRAIEIGWSDKLTPLGVLRRNGTPVEFTGSGPSAFLTSIAEIENEGTAGRNWQYWVDGERGNVSADAMPLEPGAALLWKFAEYE